MHRSFAIGLVGNCFIPIDRSIRRNRLHRSFAIGLVGNSLQLKHGLPGLEHLHRSFAIGLVGNACNVFEQNEIPPTCTDPLRSD
ncbi:hypothetical protein NIES2104_56270 [Leptolyngbya sp. NIES-2104]|nr:hypothetical protein NIES2104_56270 [Leptolyngbya sp. NIES-2104]